MPINKEMVLLKKDFPRLGGIYRMNGINERSLFGSVVRVDFGSGPNNDLVEYRPGLKPACRDPVESEFSRLYRGRAEVTNRCQGRYIREAGVNSRVKRFLANPLILQLVNKPVINMFLRKGMEKGLSPPVAKY